MIERVKFADLDEKIKMDRCSMLFSVSPEKNPDDETDDQFESVLAKIDLLPEEIQNKFFSYKIGHAILEVGKHFNLQLLQIADIARAVRSYYFGELKLEDMPTVLAREIPIDPERAKQIAQMVVKDIIQSSIGTRAVNYENLSLSQALQKYPRLGEQLVTSNPIKLKIFPDPVRPSVKNWIAEYHAVLGAGTHGTMERGNFLYHSENARRLSFGERQKLAVILKSLDENEPVSVDAEKQEIVFAQSPLTRPTATLSPNGARGNDLGIPHPETLSQRERGILGKPPLLSGEDARRAGEGDDFRFSSPQRLQSEPPQPKSYQHFDPYHIDPVGYPEDKPKPEPPRPPVPSRPEPKINGNVVDLRN